MPLNLHPSCLARLKERLVTCLPEFGLNYGSYLDRSTLSCLLDIDKTLPKQEHLSAALEEFISDTPFFDFVYGELSKELRDFQEFDSDSQVKRLIDLPNYSNLGALAERIIESFEALPRRYRFTFKLNQEVSRHFPEKELKLSDSVRLIRPDGDFCAEFKVKSGIKGRDEWLHGGGLLRRSVATEWDCQSIYLQVEKSGFVGAWISTMSSESAVSTLKSILGISLALRAFKIENVYSPTTIKQRAYVHQWINDEWTIYQGFELDEAVSNAISNLRLDTLGDSFKADEVKTGFLANRLSLLARTLSDFPVNERILLAGRWLLDSSTGKNELLSFVQATVALEILLGDKQVSDVMGLGELLRNRCAYLIGKTHAQRDEILSDFRKIHDIRSKIVHRGKDRLNSHERELFFKLRWMVNRVIQEEIERMEAKHNIQLEPTSGTLPHALGGSPER